MQDKKHIGAAFSMGPGHGQDLSFAAAAGHVHISDSASDKARLLDMWMRQMLRRLDQTHGAIPAVRR